MDNVSNYRLVYIHTTPIESKMANMIQVVSMCQAFVESGFSVTLCLPHSASSYLGFDLLKQRFHLSLDFGLNFFDQKKYLGKGLGSLVGLSRILELYDNPLYFVRDPLIASYLIKKKKLVVLELHNSLLHKNLFVDYLKKTHLKKVFHKENLLAVICISNSLKEYWFNFGVPNSKIFAFHDGVNSTYFNEKIDVDLAKKEINFDINKKYAVYVGNISLDRGIYKIIHLAKLNKDFEFIVVGGPDKYINEYLLYCVRFDVENIRFLGNVEHKKVKKFLMCSDILIGVWSSAISTMDYCSPLKLFEYMACGKPIVCEGYKSIKEVLDDKITAHLANPDDLDSLARAFRFAKMSEYKKVGYNAQELVFKEFTWVIRANKIKRVIMKNV